LLKLRAWLPAVQTWMVGFNLVLTVAVLFRVFTH